MSSLYPSLEDMQVHKMVQAQQNAFATHAQPASNPYAQSAYPQISMPSAPSFAGPTPSAPMLYPGLGDFMGLELTSEMIASNMPENVRNAETAVMSSTTGSMIAPLSNQTAGLQRANVTHGIREVVVCRGTDNKIGLRVKDINNGIFITVVCKDSPAAYVG